MKRTIIVTCKGENLPEKLIAKLVVDAQGAYRSGFKVKSGGSRRREKIIA